MDTTHELLRLAQEEGGECEILFLVVLAAEGEKPSLRFAANETLLEAVINIAGRRWLLDGVAHLCDGLKPPDDRPADVRYKRIVIERDEFS